VCAALSRDVRVPDCQPGTAVVVPRCFGRTVGRIRLICGRVELPGIPVYVC
jgi:hypothetical protein